MRSFQLFVVSLQMDLATAISKTSLVNKSIRYYFAFSQKPRKLIGNNVTRNNCDKAFGMGCLDPSCISNASTHRRGAFLFEGLRFPFRGCLIAERNKSITPFLRLGVIDSCMHLLYRITNNQALWQTRI